MQGDVFVDKRIPLNDHEQRFVPHYLPSQEGMIFGNPDWTY